ncbi:MAG: hypothetical protein V1720_14020 [bacterium]
MTKHKFLIIALTMVLFVFAGSSYAQNCCKEERTCKIETLDKNGDGKLFQCPMFCEGPSDEKGKCSKCEMDTKEYTVKEVKANCEKKCQAEGKECCKKNEHKDCSKEKSGCKKDCQKECCKDKHESKDCSKEKSEAKCSQDKSSCKESLKEGSCEKEKK